MRYTSLLIPAIAAGLTTSSPTPASLANGLTYGCPASLTNGRYLRYREVLSAVLKLILVSLDRPMSPLGSVWILQNQ